MKIKVESIVICGIVLIISSCYLTQSNANFVKSDELVSSRSTEVKAETLIPYLFDDEMINPDETIKTEINSTDMDISTTTCYCEDVIPEIAFNDKDEDVSFDKKIIEKFFLGIWRNDDEREFIIGENTECDAYDFFDNYGLIKSTYLTGDSAVIVCENYISDCYRIETKFDDPNTILFYDEYELSKNNNYIPRKYTRIGDAKMYRDTGIINSYITSLLYSNYDYLELNVNIKSYSNDVFCFNESNTSRRVVALKACNDNELVFISSFIDVADEKSQDIVFIEFKKIKVDDEWILGDWKIVDEEELVQFDKSN